MRIVFITNNKQYEKTNKTPLSLWLNIYETPEQSETKEPNRSPSRKNLFYTMGGLMSITILISGGLLILSTNGKRKVAINNCLITGITLHEGSIKYACECSDALGGTFESTFVSADLKLDLGSSIAVSDYQLTPLLYTIPGFRNNGPIHEKIVPIID